MNQGLGKTQLDTDQNNGGKCMNKWHLIQISKAIKLGCSKVHQLVFYWGWGKTSIPGDSSRDLIIPDRWRSPTTFERVTFSPSQKGHFESPGSNLFPTCSDHNDLRKVPPRKPKPSPLAVGSKDELGGSHLVSG